MTAPASPLARATTWIAILVGASLSGTACKISAEARPEVPKEIIVFVDFSQSMGGENWALIERDFREAIIPSLDAGDRLLIAPINEETLTGFHPLLDTTFPEKPVFNGWEDNTLRHNRELKAVDAEIARLRAEVRSEVPELLSKTAASRKTDIFSSLLMAQKLFHREPRRKVLILMSDMIVDYGPYRFDRIDWSVEKNQELLRELEAKGLIPDLTDVCVYVSGVSAGSAELAGQISAFWGAYFRHTHADLDPSRYAHVLLHWPPSTGCPSSDA